MAQIPLPDKLLVQLRRTAQQDGLSLPRLFEKMLDAYLVSHRQVESQSSTGVPESIPEAALSDPIDREIAAFFELHPSLVNRYPGHYVAIYQGQLIDHDADKLALFTRIEEAYPDEFVLLRPVQEQPEREFYFRSPRYIERV